MKMPDRSVIGHVHVEDVGDFDIVMERSAALPVHEDEPTGIDPERLAESIHAFNVTVGSCDHESGIPDCVDRANEHIATYDRLTREASR